uniref:Tetraspanin n=1 Tax=Neogobius melanostomus TaxID=47308 RepID=A0A8C6UWP2_9GOBI
MGKGCLTATKYFLFLFNLIFFLLGGVILGFGLWLLLDNQSFIVVLNDSTSVKAACYILIGVGGFSMLMGFVGCLGAIYEVRCLLGLYFTCLLLILIAQITAGALIYFQKDVLDEEMSKIVSKVLEKYSGNNTTTEQAWDFIQRNMKCCGWSGRQDWNGNMAIVNSSQTIFPCSCQNSTDLTPPISGFCDDTSGSGGSVYEVGCSESVEAWLRTNMWVILGICLGVAFIELLGMILSICLCKKMGVVDYTKVPKF